MYILSVCLYVSGVTLLLILNKYLSTALDLDLDYRPLPISRQYCISGGIDMEHCFEIRSACAEVISRPQSNCHR